MFRSLFEKMTGERLVSDQEHNDLSNALEDDIQQYMRDNNLDPEQTSSRNEAIDWANGELVGTNVTLEREEENSGGFWSCLGGGK